MLKALALERLFFRPSPSAALAARQKFKAAGSSMALIAVSVVLIAANAALLVNYLASVNSQSLQGYEMKQAQNRLTELQDANRKLNLKVAELNSMVSIQNNFLSANYVTAGTGKFLQSTQYTYAPR